MTAALTIAACLLLAALVVLAVEVVERRQIRRQAEVRKQRRRELAGPPDWRLDVEARWRYDSPRIRTIQRIVDRDQKAA